MRTLPFYIPKILGGLARAHGVARLDESALVLEFEVRDNLTGLFESAVKEFQLDMDDIDSADVHLGWFSSVFSVQMSRQSLVEEIPQADRGRIHLYLKRRDRQAAQEIASTINLKASARKLEAVRKDLNL